MKLFFLLMFFVSAYADEKLYRMMHKVHGKTVVREITLNEEESYARIKQLLRAEESNGQFYDFKTGYVAERSKNCIVAKSRYTMEDIEEFIAGQVKNEKKRIFTFDIGKEGTPIDDVEKYAGKRITRFCGKLKAYKGVPKRMVRGGCWWGWLCSPDKWFGRR